MSGMSSRSRRLGQVDLLLPKACLIALLACPLGACGDDAAPAAEGGAPFAEAGSDGMSARTDAESSGSPDASDGSRDVVPGNDASAQDTGDSASSDAAAAQSDSASSDAAAAQSDSASSDSAAARDVGDAADPYAAIITNYRSWRALGEKPYDISEEIFGLCRLPSSAENQFVKSVHAHYALLDWANRAAALTLDAPTPSHFAEGSVIVKEKYAARDGGTPTLAALGIMLKRSAGFDPAHGDWEFAYWDNAEGLRKDDTRACGSCHDSSSAVDHVFIDDHWRRSDAGL
jgi:hypothetical protein